MTRNAGRLLLVCAFAVLACADPVPLELLRVLPVEGPRRFEPSGLTLRDGALYTVADKHNNTIFRLELGEEQAKAVPYLQFTAPSPPERALLDLEGIAAGEDGSFYLVSENFFRVLRVPKGGGPASWATPNLEAVGVEVGLFRSRNANLEGLALLAPGLFITCAERQPRGLVLADMRTETPVLSAFECETTTLRLAPRRPPISPGSLLTETGSTPSCATPRLSRNW